MGLFRLCVFFCLARYGFSVDVDLVCPESWEQGTKATLTCAVDISRWAQPNPCTDSFSYTVDFILQPEGGTGSSACTVLNVDTSCDGTANAQGCGCNKTSTHYNMFYIVVANKATHENRSWNCQPDCLVTSTSPPSNPLSGQTSTGCKKTVFPQPCDNNPCAPGKCTVVNDTRNCNCDGSYYKGLLCKEVNCKGVMIGDKCLIDSEFGAVLIAAAVAIVLATVVSLVLFAFPKTIKVHLNPKGNIDSEAAMKEHINNVKEKIANSRLNELCAVQIQGDYVIIRGINIWSVYKVKIAIERIINESNPGSHNVTPAPETDPSITGHEPTPENAAKKTGHKATGRPHNGVADEDV